ncbi:CsbD family protein [Streptomyces orinoci]|uniref:CsbD family protein n=1 Tax=Streptomyces orinoci TaxID=67339 RepID=A0ABV3JYW6_STRON|nr:CsbD family protein [Streptomyces orinoci]
MSTKNRAKAKAEQTKGRLKEAAGHLTGDKRTQTEGRVQRIKGDIQDAVEKVRHPKHTKKKHGH